MRRIYFGFALLRQMIGGGGGGGEVKLLAPLAQLIRMLRYKLNLRKLIFSIIIFTEAGISS